MKNLTLVACSIIIVCFGLSSCGDDDCPSCPPLESPEPDYHLLYSYGGQWPNRYVLTYSTKTGKVVDSAFYGGSMFKSMDFSHDGRYACYSNNHHDVGGYSETWVTDTQTGDTVSYKRDLGSMGVLISPDDQYALLFGGHYLAVVRLPSLEIIFEDSADSWGGHFDVSSKILYISMEGSLDSMSVLEFDSNPPVWSSFPIKFYDGTPALSLGPLCITDTTLVLHCSDGQNKFLQIYRLRDHKLIWQTRVTSQSYRGVALQPVTNRLFLAYNGGFNHPTGGIDVLDLNTRIFRNYIIPGELNLGYDAFVPSHLEITPDGKKLYVLNGGNGFWLGPILEIDIATKEVARRIDNPDGNSWLMRLNPRNWAE